MLLNPRQSRRFLHKKGNIIMTKVRVTVLNGQQIKFPDGHVETRSSHPIHAPTYPDMVWHAALGKFIPAEKSNTTFEDEIDA